MSKNSVKSSILIESDGKHFHLGDLILKRVKGEIYYKPSSQPKFSFNNEEVIMLEHFSWHKSGGVLMKLQNGSHLSIESGCGEITKPGKRQIIQDIGYQELFREWVSDLNILPIVTITPKDVVLQSRDYYGPFIFLLSIVSGTHIVAFSQGQKTPVYPVDGKTNPLFLDSSIGCLGAESGNADKLIQFHLEKYSHPMESGKRLFSSAPDSQIKKIYD
jgi:hypothetical protein